MHAKYYFGAAAAAIVVAGVGFEARERAETHAAPFLKPLAMSSSICGKRPGAEARTRAYFARIGQAFAQSGPAQLAPEATPDQIGTIAYEITTKDPSAQAHFNRGLAHLWNFNHGAAVAAFKAAQAADPSCAMCFWAEGFALGPNINAMMANDAIAPAFAATRKAKELAKGASEKERALIDALAKRYASAPVKDRAKLDAAFADAMDAVAKEFPEDDFVQVTAAEAMMDTQPWDYWEADGRTPKGRAGRTLSLIEAVLARSPDHQAAIHLYIHATEATRDPFRAVPYADRLADLSPGLGHLIHMPSHVYYRIGRFKQSIDLNVEAAAADEAFLAANKAEPMFEFGYYVHNLHFVMMAALMAGDAKTALAAAEKLNAKLPLQMAADVPFAQPIKVAPYYAWATFAEPSAVLALQDPGEEVPFVRAAWHYARGEAMARGGDASGARREAEAIARIAAEEDLSQLHEINIPATDILKIERLTVIARAAAAENDLGGAIEAMEEVVALQEGLNYTEPPYWYYPAKQTLAGLVLRKGDAERAEQLFVETLAEAPNSGWALHGLAAAYKAQGEKAAQKYANALFKEAWYGDGKALSLARL
jgi:hypothetical protein